MALRIVALTLPVLAVVAWFMLGTRPEVSVTEMRRGDVAEIVYATGIVEPVTWAKVAPLVQARITELCGCEGQGVAAGDPLARLDARAAEADLAELEARRDYLERERDRLSDLAERNFAARAEVDRAQSEAAQVEAAIAGARTRLENYVLRAPTGGVVLRQEGEVGEIADPGAVLYWVGQTRPLRVVADINEEDIPRVAPGQRTLLSADAFPDRRLEAEVASITPMGDPVRKTYRVRFALPDDTPLLIGMSVEVNIVVSERRGVPLVPASAVDADGAVWVVEDGVARRREVTIGVRGTTATEVAEGLSDGVMVIAPAPGDLADGAKVRVVP